MDRLRSTIDRFQAEGRIIDIFFRDDDVDEDESSLRRLIEIFLERAVPINLEIIPGRLTSPAAALLRHHQNRHRELLRIDQHGWTHTNHELEGRKCEFGPSRSFDQQLADIASGRKVLEDAFGEAISGVFTPPWNRCTTDTYLALDQLGFEVLSKKRGREEVKGYRFREVSVTLDLSRQLREGSPEDTVDELMRQLNGLDSGGIMLHHKLMDDAACDLLTGWLDELRCCRAVNFISLEKSRKV